MWHSMITSELDVIASLLLGACCVAYCCIPPYTYTVKVTVKVMVTTNSGDDFYLLLSLA